LPYCAWLSELAQIRPLAHFQYKNRSYSYRIQCSQNLVNAKGLSPVFRTDNLYHPNLCKYSCFLIRLNSNPIQYKIQPEPNSNPLVIKFILWINMATVPFVDPNRTTIVCKPKPSFLFHEWDDQARKNFESSIRHIVVRLWTGTRDHVRNEKDIQRKRSNTK
jgi:hypothetical protein